MFKIIGLIVLLKVTRVLSRAGSGGEQDYTTSDFQEHAVATHNYYRSLHGVPILTVNQSLVNFAKSRCQNISNYDHLGAPISLGENLYWGWSSEQVLKTATHAVEVWYNQIKHYDYDNPGYSPNTGSFTQVIWAKSSKIGCARCSGQFDAGYETYIICKYSPPGNVKGKFEANVPPRLINYFK